MSEKTEITFMQTRLIRLASEEWHLQHGYALIDRKLVVNEEEAVAIRTIFDQYVNTDLGANGIAKHLENHGIHKMGRQNGNKAIKKRKDGSNYKNFYYSVIGGWGSGVLPPHFEQKKSRRPFLISCSVCRCVDGGYLVVKVQDKLT